MTDFDSAEGRAFGFTGRWQDYAPIAFTNLLLTIVTLGFYTFWARTRTRRYLWSNTRFIDDRLEWTGTGLELFVGYLLAIVFFIVPFGVINLVLQGVLLRGHAGIGAIIVAVLYLALLYVFGIARFRALRYRLSRTYWRGIRGGSDDQGIAYGGQYFWRTLVGMITVWLMIPWSMTTLWNRRWDRMSFGSLRFRASAEWGPILPRFLLFYLVPIALFVGILLLAGLGFLAGMGRAGPPGAGQIVAIAIGALLFYVVFFGVLGLVALLFYSAFYREAVGATTLGPLDFAFEARTKDWVKLYLGNIGLVLITFGVGYIFLTYRNWSFFVRHMAAYGDLDVARLTQSTTREPGQGEGLLDAFDVGAI